MMFKNDNFYHFIVRNEKEEIINYVCMFRLDYYNKTNNSYYRNGYIYKMFFNDDNIINSMELINEYIHNNNIFDIITCVEIFNNNEYKLMNYFKSVNSLNYYFYNINNILIENHRNGIVTI